MEISCKPPENTQSAFAGNKQINNCCIQQGREEWFPAGNPVYLHKTEAIVSSQLIDFDFLWPDAGGLVQVPSPNFSPPFYGSFYLHRTGREGGFLFLIDRFPFP